VAKAREAEEKRAALAAEQEAHAKEFAARIKRQVSLVNTFAGALTLTEAAAAAARKAARAKAKDAVNSAVWIIEQERAWGCQSKGMGLGTPIRRTARTATI
jgi:hypothetical protein